MVKKIGGAILLLLMTSGTLFAQAKQLTCIRTPVSGNSENEVQLTIDESAGTAFFHYDLGINYATSSPAEFTSDFISWQSTREYWQGRTTTKSIVRFRLNRNTGTLEVDGSPSYSCKISTPII